MYPSGIPVTAILLLLLSVGVSAETQDVMVLTFHQTWNSRVYILDMDGQVLDWHQFDMYRLCDLEVVSDEVHVVDAFAPRSFILDLDNWSLETIIDDWSLFYFYDLAFDGQYLYVTEWDMNRYLPDGTKDSSADFDHDSYGSCFAEGYLWTICEDGLIHCWDTGNWPQARTGCESK